MKQRRFFLTGGTGFLGTYFARRLVEQGHEVHLFSRHAALPERLQALRSQLTLHVGNLSDPDSIRKSLKLSNPQEIWHLATHYAASGPLENAGFDFQVNLIGTANLLSASDEVPYECFINTGSAAEYGIKHSPMREDDFPEPTGSYGVSKLASTLLVQAHARRTQRPLYTLRLFNPFGPFEPKHRLIPTMLEACLHRTGPRLASPKTVRDFLYIEDVFRAYGMLADAALLPGEVLNISSGVQTTVEDLWRHVQNVTDNCVSPFWGGSPPRAQESPCWAADIEKARNLLQWSPHYSLEMGLHETWEWHRKDAA